MKAPGFYGAYLFGWILPRIKRVLKNKTNVNLSVTKERSDGIAYLLANRVTVCSL